MTFLKWKIESEKVVTFFGGGDRKVKKNDFLGNSDDLMGWGRWGRMNEKPMIFFF